MRLSELSTRRLTIWKTRLKISFLELVPSTRRVRNIVLKSLVIKCCPLITLCLGSIGMDRVVVERYYLLMDLLALSR